jgi:hypothetical protein
LLPFDRPVAAPDSDGLGDLDATDSDVDEAMADPRRREPDATRPPSDDPDSDHDGDGDDLDIPPAALAADGEGLSAADDDSIFSSDANASSPPPAFIPPHLLRSNDDDFSGVRWQLRREIGGKGGRR